MPGYTEGGELVLSKELSYGQLLTDQAKFIEMIKSGHYDIDEKNAELGGIPLLGWAMIINQPEIAKAIIAAGADVNAIDDQKRSLLHMIVEDASPMGQLLIAAQANVNVKDGRGWTPLHVAAYRGWAGIAKFLVQTYPELINVKDNSELTALQIAHRPITQYDLDSLLLRQKVHLGVTKTALTKARKKVMAVLIAAGAEDNVEAGITLKQHQSPSRKRARKSDTGLSGGP